MHTTPFELLKTAIRLFFLSLAAQLTCGGARAELLRLSSWDMARATNTASLTEAVQVLKPLKPDVILLQNVRDWQTCVQLGQTIQTGAYTVVVCSAFRDPKSGASTRFQAAILAKQRAYFSWSDCWKNTAEGATGDGYAFAALQYKNRRLGLFSVQFEPAPEPAISPAEATRQMLQQVRSVRQWYTNRVNTFIVAGAGPDAVGLNETHGLLAQSGFSNLLQALPVAEAGPGQTAEQLLFAESSVLPGNIRRLPHGISCELEMDPGVIAARSAPKPALVARSVPEVTQSTAVAQTQSRQPPPERTRQAAQFQTNAPTAAADLSAAKPPEAAVPQPKPEAQSRSAARNATLFGMGLGATVVLVAVAAWVLARHHRRHRKRQVALLPSGLEAPGNAPSYTLVVTAAPLTGSASEPAPAQATRPVVVLESTGRTQTTSAAWQQRALAAERKAEQATALVRAGLLPQLSHWLKQKLVTRLVEERSGLLQTHAAASNKVNQVEERLARIEQQIQHQNQAYERRIEELTVELMAAKEENRELIRARIAQVRSEMEAARARMRAQARSEGGTPD